MPGSLEAPCTHPMVGAMLGSTHNGGDHHLPLSPKLCITPCTQAKEQPQWEAAETTTDVSSPIPLPNPLPTLRDRYGRRQVAICPLPPLHRVLTLFCVSLYPYLPCQAGKHELIWVGDLLTLSSDPSGIGIDCPLPLRPQAQPTLTLGAIASPQGFQPSCREERQ